LNQHRFFKYSSNQFPLRDCGGGKEKKKKKDKTQKGKKKGGEGGEIWRLISNLAYPRPIRGKKKRFKGGKKGGGKKKKNGPHPTIPFNKETLFCMKQKMGETGEKKKERQPSISLSLFLSFHIQIRRRWGKTKKKKLAGGKKGNNCLGPKP